MKTLIASHVGNTADLTVYLQKIVSEETFSGKEIVKAARRSQTTTKGKIRAYLYNVIPPINV